MVHVVRVSGVGLALLCLLSACKSISPAVVENARQEGGWYRYLPRHAPGFCLRTRHAMIWHDNELDVGYWQGLHPQKPHRVLMEARGHCFILHRRYVWDGNSIGSTAPADLMPSLRHDALYHALKEGAPLDRGDIDRAYLRDVKAAHGRHAYLRYAGIRLFGGLYNKRGGEATLIIRKTSPDTAPAPLEPDHPDEDEAPPDYTPPTA